MFDRPESTAAQFGMARARRPFVIRFADVFHQHVQKSAPEGERGAIAPKRRPNTTGSKFCRRTGATLRLINYVAPQSA